MKTLTLRDGISLPPDGIVRSAECEALFSAAQIIATAEADLDARRIAAEAEIERRCHSAGEDAYREGIAMFVDAAEQLKAAERDVREKVIGLVRCCLDSVVETLPEEAVFQTAIRRVLPDIDPEGEVVFTVHPDRATALDRALEDGEGALLGEGRIGRVETNPALSLGSCIILTGSSVIDISVDVMTDRLIEVLDQTWSGASLTKQSDAAA